MARPRVGDGGDGLQMWMIAADILNKQSVAGKQQGVILELGVWASSLNSSQ